jgi:hypothetical protein
MSAPQKTGWTPDGEYLGPFTEVTTFPCPVPGFCPCAAPCKRAVETMKSPALEAFYGAEETEAYRERVRKMYAPPIEVKL